ncbi:hypothetical protein OEZ85_000574 [Tetradesmus obliquus]|uniref:Uncharacterized protein n=1 Tax=Tetradesmus obliquus TaxID=3088 RepID=A0ABY8UJP5_TETOB|nr:hypothetical protein OEZ85_000574 [Tetradesmus obliquus]
MSAAERRAAISEQIQQYQHHQQHLLHEIQATLHNATQGGQQGVHRAVHTGSVEEQIGTLTLLSKTREYVARLKAAAEAVKQLERQVHPASHLQDQAVVEPLVELSFAAAQGYASCKAELAGLAASSFSQDAAPQQLRCMEQQLVQRLQAAHDLVHSALSSQIHRCLTQCGWPPPVVPPKAGSAGTAPAAAAGTSGSSSSGELFSPAQAAETNQLQRLMLALTRLQLVSQQEQIAAAVQSGGGGDAPLLWAAAELAAPLNAQLAELFGASGRGSPGDVNNPDLLLGTVHRLALENGRRIDFLQAVVQALELHGAYHIGVEFTRALRDGVKQLLRTYKLPEVAAAGTRELWLAWIDALIAFEGSLGRSGLLGCYWEVADARDLPVLLLRGSTLSVFGEDPAWLDAWLEAEAAAAVKQDAWLEAEAAAAVKQVEAILYSEAGWGPGQTLLLEDGRPAWHADLWPPKAAEELVSLVESLLDKLRFIPQPEAQERYLAGAVGAVLQQAHGRISRMLHQADLFKDFTSETSLLRVCMCVCFCHYVEQQLQELHDDAQVMVTRILDSQQQQQQYQENNIQHAGQDQQQQHALPNGNDHRLNNSSWQAAGQQQQQPNGPMAAPVAAAAAAPGGSGQQQEGEQLSQAAAAKLRVLAKPIGEFSTCRREWVLKLGKAAALGFMQHAAGYTSRGALFKASSESLPALAAEGQLWSSGVVSGDLQPGLAWLAGLLEKMSGHLDKGCFGQAWSAAAAAINRELFNNVACEALFSDAGALQLMIDAHALMSVFGRYTPRPQAHFRELRDAVALLNLQQQQADFVKQAVAAASRAPNAAEVLKSVGVYHLDPELADTVMSLRMYKP